jgi:hypothetical protein
MGVMTTVAGRCFYRIAGMGFFERILFIIMAGITNHCFFIFKKTGLIRAMGTVTGQARPLLKCLMFYLLFEVFLLVALVADITPFCL